MNTFFASAGRASANVLDAAIDVPAAVYVATHRATVSFAAGWKAQRRLNKLGRHGIAVVRFRAVRT